MFIKAISYYLPSKILSNEELIREFPEWSVEKVAKKAYGAGSVLYSELAKTKIEEYTRLGHDKLLICVAKTQNSLSDDSKLLNAPLGFTLHVKDVSLSLGAGFIVVYTGSIITMPGLPEIPAAKNMGLDDNGEPYGIF